MQVRLLPSDLELEPFREVVMKHEFELREVQAAERYCVAVSLFDCCVQVLPIDQSLVVAIHKFVTQLAWLRFSFRRLWRVPILRCPCRAISLLPAVQFPLALSLTIHCWSQSTGFLSPASAVL